jgi:hypothetical protein
MFDKKDISHIPLRNTNTTSKKTGSVSCFKIICEDSPFSHCFLRIHWVMVSHRYGPHRFHPGRTVSRNTQRVVLHPGSTLIQRRCKHATNHGEPGDIYKHILCGGLEHEFYDFPFSWECHHPN